MKMFSLLSVFQVKSRLARKYVHFASFLNNFIVVKAPLNVSLFQNFLNIGFVLVTLIKISLLQTKKLYSMFQND